MKGVSDYMSIATFKVKFCQIHNIMIHWWLFWQDTMAGQCDVYCIDLFICYCKKNETDRGKFE